MTIGSHGAFTLHTEFAVTKALFGEIRTDFEFGLDVFQKSSGSDEGMCIQVESDVFVSEAQAKVLALLICVDFYLRHPLHSISFAPTKEMAISQSWRLQWQCPCSTSQAQAAALPLQGATCSGITALETLDVSRIL
jgi:hypothetical protein